MNEQVGKKQISINMIANIISYSSNLIISFVLTPFLINSIGKETYSFYPMANTIVGYMSVITNSMNTMASRFVTISLVKKDYENANQYFSSVLSANSLFGIVLLLPMILFVLFIDSFLNIPINSIAAIKVLFSFVFASALVNIFGSIFGIATFAKNRIDLRSFRELVTSILKLIFFFLFYKFFSPSIIYVGIVTFIIAIINIIFQIFYTKKLLPEIKISKKYISLKHTKELLTSSIWNVVNYLGNALLAGMTIILANKLYGAEASGTFSIVQVVPQFISGVVVMLVGIFFPVITYKYAQNDYEGLVKEIFNIQKIVGFVSCAVIVVFSALSREFFSLWTPAENANYLMLLSLLSIIPYFFIACMWPLTNLNIVMNKVKTPAFFTILIGILNVVITLLLNKLFHASLYIIPAVSAFLQVIWVGVFMPLYASKNLNKKWHTFYPVLIKLLLISIPIFLFVYFGKNLFEINNWVIFVMTGVFFGGIALIIFATGIFGLKNIKIEGIKILNKLKK